MPYVTKVMVIDETHTHRHTKYEHLGVILTATIAIGHAHTGTTYRFVSMLLAHYGAIFPIGDFPLGRVLFARIHTFVCSLLPICN